MTQLTFLPFVCANIKLILHAVFNAILFLRVGSTMARLDQVIPNIVDIFMQYADDGEGKKCQLNKEELQKMLEEQIQSPDLKVNNGTSFV